MIPTFQNPFKDSSTIPASVRVQWMQKITQHYPKVEVLDIESSLTKASSTYETLIRLKLRYNFTQKPYLIIGADNVNSLPKWSQFDLLQKEVHFVVADRKTFETKHTYLRLNIDRDISSTKVRAQTHKEDLPSIVADEIMAYLKEKNVKS